jgi:hypothetical protein
MLRARFEWILAAVLALASIATIIWPRWVESLTGLEPDGGSGELEWWIVGLTMMFALVSAILSRRDYRAFHQQRSPSA